MAESKKVPLWVIKTGADKIAVHTQKVAHVIVADLACIRNISAVFQTRLKHASCEEKSWLGYFLPLSSSFDHATGVASALSGNLLGAQEHQSGVSPSAITISTASTSSDSQAGMHDLFYVLLASRLRNL